MSADMLAARKAQEMDGSLNTGWSSSQWEACCNDQTDYSIHWDLGYFKVTMESTCQGNSWEKGNPISQKCT